MEKDIKKESEKLFAKIKAHTPKLVEYLVKAATYWGVTIDEFLVDSINRYVIIDKDHEIFLCDQTMYNNTVYASFEVAQGYCTTYEEVITLYEYICNLSLCSPTVTNSCGLVHEVCTAFEQ